MKPGNTLKITSLGKDWCDKDVVMLHACFQLLEDCVENEDLFHMWETKGDPKAAPTKRELRKLHRWWLKRKARTFDDLNSPAGVRQYNQDTAKLVRLIELRQHLWT